VKAPALKTEQFFILAFLSYPVLVLFDRGNLEMIVFVLLFWFLHLYYRDVPSPWAGVFLAAAIAMKFYPATLLVLPLADRRYRDALVAVSCSIVMWMAGAVAVAAIARTSVGSVVGNAGRMLFGAGGHQSAAVAGSGVQHGHSLWSPIGMALRFSGSSLDEIAGYATPYAISCVVVFICVSLYVVLIERRAWAKVALLTICGILLPYVSADYTLVNLFLPMMLFVGAGGARHATAIAVLLALTFVPMDFFYLPYSDVSTSVLIYPTIVTAAAVLIIVGGLESREKATSRGKPG
jgi:hypothetical protein